MLARLIPQKNEGEPHNTIVGNIILSRKRRTLFRDWNKRNLLTYFAGLGPDLELFNFYWRPWLLRWAGIPVGRMVAIMPKIQITLGKLTVGEEVLINSDCRFACGGGIHIGNYCQISARVSFETIGHQLVPVKNGKRPSNPAPITVKDNVWIGSGAILLPGVTIGEGAVVAAGAVVTKNVPSCTVVAGVPAQIIRDLAADYEPSRQMAECPSLQPELTYN